MTITVEAIIEELKRVQLPDGSNIVDSDMVRAVTIEDSKVNFVLEVPGELGERMALSLGSTNDICIITFFIAQNKILEKLQKNV